MHAHSIQTSSQQDVSKVGEFPPDFIPYLIQYTDLILYIADFLDFQSARNFSRAHPVFSDSLNDSYLNMRKREDKKIKSITQCVVSSINTYLSKSKSHPGYARSVGQYVVDFSQTLAAGLNLGLGFFSSNNMHHGNAYRGNNQSIKYDKGFHRAYCFKHILGYPESIPPALQIFAIYTLLAEKNGQILKSTVSDGLQSVFGKHIIAGISWYVEKKYGGQLSSMQEKLLNMIHNEMCYEYTNNNYYEYKKGNILGLWKDKLIELEKEAEEIAANIESKESEAISKPSI